MANIQQRMVAASGWRYHRFGAPDKVLSYEKYRVPFNRNGRQVVVKMLAAPVHKHDKNMIAGSYGPMRPIAPTSSAPVGMKEGGYCRMFPAVAGTEGVGVVEEVGRGALGGGSEGGDGGLLRSGLDRGVLSPGFIVKEGDLVWINNQSVGTWTTHVVTDVENVDVLPLPSLSAPNGMNGAEVDVEYLASMSVYHTAYHLTNSFVRLQPGDTVVQTGATSAVAQVCQGLIRARGAKLFQTMLEGRSNHSELVNFYKSHGAYTIVPYHYAKTNYMRRLLSDVPAPRLLLNHVGGPLASSLVRLLAGGSSLGNNVVSSDGEGGAGGVGADTSVVVTYGNCSGRPMHVANSHLLNRGVVFRHFFLPTWIAEHSRAQRMRVHQNVMEAITLTQGNSAFKAERYKMANKSDSQFAFSAAWDSPLNTGRKPVLRMTGEYGEWRKSTNLVQGMELGRAVWDDLLQQVMESTACCDQPLNMKYYTPFGNFFGDFHDAEEARQTGYREVFFKRPNMPRNNTDEVRN